MKKTQPPLDTKINSVQSYINLFKCSSRDTRNRKLELLCICDIIFATVPDPLRYLFTSLLIIRLVNERSISIKIRLLARIFFRKF